MKKPYTAQQRLDGILRRTKAGPGGCLLWTGPKDKAGYGRCGGPGRSAHRAVWLGALRAIPPGTEIDHICRVRACVNLDHLRAVTHAENMQNREQPEDRCYLGHVKTRTAGGALCCKPCRMDALRRWRASHPSEARAIYREAARRRRATPGEGAARGPVGG